MNVIDTINEAADLIDQMAEDLNYWKMAFAGKADANGNAVTADLIEKAYTVSKKLRGEPV